MSGPSSPQNSVRTGVGWERPDVFSARAENTIHPRNTLLSSNKSTRREEADGGGVRGEEGGVSRAGRRQARARRKSTHSR